MALRFIKECEEPGVEIGDQFLVLGALDEVFRFIGIFLKVVKFVEIPYAVIANVFVSVAANTVGCWGVGVVAFPIIFVKQIVPPGNGLTGGKLEEAFSVEVIRWPDTTRFEERWRDIDIGDDLRNLDSRLDDLRAVQDEGDPNGCLVSDSLVDKSMIAKLETIVAHVNHECGFELIGLPEPIEDPAKIFVHCKECLTVASVVVLKVKVF